MAWRGLEQAEQAAQELERERLMAAPPSLASMSCSAMSSHGGGGHTVGLCAVASQSLRACVT